MIYLDRRDAETRRATAQGTDRWASYAATVPDDVLSLDELGLLGDHCKDI